MLGRHFLAEEAAPLLYFLLIDTNDRGREKKSNPAVVL